MPSHGIGLKPLSGFFAIGHKEAVGGKCGWDSLRHGSKGRPQKRLPHHANQAGNGNERNAKRPNINPGKTRAQPRCAVAQEQGKGMARHGERCTSRTLRGACQALRMKRQHLEKHGGISQVTCRRHITGQRAGQSVIVREWGTGGSIHLSAIVYQGLGQGRSRGQWHAFNHWGAFGSGHD